MAKEKSKDRDRPKGKKVKKLSKEDRVKLAAAQALVEEKRAQLAKAPKKASPADFEKALRAGPGFSLAALDTSATPGFSGDRALGESLMPELATAVGELQERLYAESREGGKRAVLLIIQGMDTSGKGGIMRHVVGAADPQGVQITAFKAPTAEERAHPFLWRIRGALPKPGIIGVFDRSQYEDVLIVRVHNLVPRAQWARRYAQINAFEKKTVADGITIVKVMLHISKDEQQARLAARLANPEKYWKYNPGDLDERSHWDDYMAAYQAAIDKCSTEVAPWYVVPADKKWYARWAVQQLLVDALADLDPQWPAADFDVEAEKARLAES